MATGPVPDGTVSESAPRPPKSDLRGIRLTIGRHFGHFANKGHDLPSSPSIQLLFIYVCNSKYVEMEI